MATFTLRDFLNACPEMNSFPPSKFVCQPAAGKILTINDIQYEVRTCCFQGSEEKTFGNFVINNGLDTRQATPIDDAKFYVFSQGSQGADTGIYYLIALRILQGDDLKDSVKKSDK